MWVCGSCGQRINDSYDYCWKCRESRNPEASANEMSAGGWWARISATSKANMLVGIGIILVIAAVILKNVAGTALASAYSAAVYAEEAHTAPAFVLYLTAILVWLAGTVSWVAGCCYYALSKGHQWTLGFLGLLGPLFGLIPLVLICRKPPSNGAAGGTSSPSA